MTGNAVATTRGLADVKLHLVDSLDEVLKLFNWLGERRERDSLAFDTETTGLVVGKDRVRLVQVGDENHGWSIPFHRWGGVFEDLVRRWDGTWDAHNAKFDTGMLGHEGIQMPRARVRDTRIMAHILEPHYSTALKNVAARHVDAKAAGLQFVLQGTGFTWETVPIDFPPYWTYAALDTVLTHRVGDVLWPRVEAAGCVEAFEIENAVSWIIERMERYGAHIDVAYAREKLIAFERFVKDAETWCVANYGVKPGSNAAVVKVLEEAGYGFNKATKTGAVALDKEVLGGIDHPLAVTVLARRKIQKLASTYLTHFVNEVDVDDLIHPTINVLGARTSRMSMQEPNLQNLPRRSEGDAPANTVRTCVSAREGNVMMFADFDQVEMRMLASMAREESMIQAFLSPNDFFVELAKLVYDDDTIVKADPRRQVVKNAGYATIYGAGVAKFAATAGISFEQGQMVRNRWDQLFPRVAAFQREVIGVAQSRYRNEGVPYVRCPVTRRFQVADPGKEYALINFLIQGAAAAVLKKKLIELDNAGFGPYMVVPVHDEIILDVPKEHADDAAFALKKVMNDTEMFTVPLSASVSWGPTWGDKEAYEGRMIEQ